MRLPIAASLVLVFACRGHSAELYQLDPFAQATSGYARCPTVPPPLVSADEMRAQAHVRSERGLRCAMEGTCEPGGSYKRDPEINERMKNAIASDRRFARTSIWITTSRKWVTLEGCVRSARDKRALVDLLRAQPDVERVFDQTTIGVPRKRP